MGDDISYVWVTKGDSIPHTEKTHGMLNVINTAKQNPDRQINVYVDSEKNQISYTLLPNIEQPKNIKFIPVSHLVTECIIKATKNKHDVSVIDEAYRLYLLEMKHGHPAYAGNFIKLLALYKGGIVSDIGVVYDEKTFSDLKDLKIKNIIDTKKGFLYNLKGLFGFFKDDKFHNAGATLLWSSEKQNKSAYQAIKYINSYYKNESSLYVFLDDTNKIYLNVKKEHELIEKKIRELPLVEQGKLTIERQNKLLKEKEIEKVKFIREKIYEIYANSRYKYYLKIIENAVPAIKSGKLALEIGYKFQDKGYGFALGNNSVTSCLLPPMLWNHKISHLCTDFYNANAQFVDQENKIVEKTIPISNITRTSSFNKGKKYVIPTVLERRGSVTETVKVEEKVKSLTSTNMLSKIRNFLKRKHRVEPTFNGF